MGAVNSTMGRSSQTRPRSSTSLRRAFMLERAGDIDGAHDVLMDLIVFHRERKQQREALAACRKALSLREGVSLHGVAAELCVEQERHAEAFTHLQQALGLAKKPNVRLNIIRLMARLRPDDLRVFRMLATVAEEVGMPSLAKRAEVRAQKLLHRTEATVSTRLASVPVRMGKALRTVRPEPEEGLHRSEMSMPSSSTTGEDVMKAALASPAGVVAHSSLEWVEVPASRPEVPTAFDQAGEE
ncbi:MAG: hypothetical protein KTR25_13165 [Myxococcales bacterium]|nr:hypothetical protein [Myxococcales bacterium]